MRLFGYPYNDLVICKDSPDYLVLPIVEITYDINTYFDINVNNFTSTEGIMIRYSSK